MAPYTTNYVYLEAYLITRGLRNKETIREASGGEIYDAGRREESKKVRDTEERD